MVAEALIKSILRPLKESYRVPPYEIHEYTILKYNNLSLHKQSSAGYWRPNVPPALRSAFQRLMKEYPVMP